MIRHISVLALLGVLGGHVPVAAQEAAQDADATAEVTEAGDAASSEADDALLTEAELQTLVAPVALYPDTLLIQILVGATAPLDVVKADRLVSNNPDASPEELSPLIEAEGFDPSVEVLAEAFPTVLGEMAEHIEWTETMGNAMLAQSDDVMDAVQVMRDQAIDSGALVSTEEQLVSQDETTDTIVIQPADPEVVYVPQYDYNQVYSPGWQDVVVGGALVFGTVALIDAIFDDDDDWYGYWGCRNCAGWGGGPIYREPDIDIDIDGDVNIGNDINIGDNDGDLGDRLPDRDQEGWRPDPDQSEAAKDKIADRRNEDGATTLPIERPTERPSAQDDLRSKLSAETGVQDIARPENRDAAVAAGAGAALGAGAAAATRPKVDKAANLKKSSGGSTPKVNRPSAPQKPAAKPAVQKPSVNGATRKAAPKVAKKHSAPKARQASSRGGKSRGKVKRR